MARRSPMNARYQKFQEPPGKTRKSAAAAKPTRKAAESSASSPSKSKSASGKSGASRVPYDPQTPEFKATRRLWWILLVTGVVMVAISWAVRTYVHLGTSRAGDIIATISLGIAYGSIFYALYLDFAKMRPMRQAWKASGGKMTSAPRPAEKPAKGAKSPAEKSSGKADDADSTADDE